MMWNVDTPTRNFPVYLKDSVLNTNLEFDYGPYEDLKSMVLNQNITMTAYAFPFTEKGTYVF